MKSTTILLSIFLLLISSGVEAQTKPRPKQNPPSKAEINKMMEDVLNAEDMSKEEREEMKKMMKEVMPALTNKKTNTADYGVFTDNKQLIPKRDAARINAIPKKAFTDADVTATTTNLYNKLMLRAKANEKSIIATVIAKEKKGSSLMAAAVIAFLQGHNQAAMGLAMKAVLADPKNINYQNNLAAILSQSGYPEKSIPYLNKIHQQLPGNSTINNNLGFAWLSLGELDSAKRFYDAAALRNPVNPETKLCFGLFKELEGDPIEAFVDYVDAFEEIPNPFAETMINNRKAGDHINNLDFEKLKKRISIHEFFTKEWIKLPQFSNSVNGFSSDQSIRDGYDIMYKKLENKIAALEEAANAQLNALYDKGENEFKKTLTRESIEGMNMMSKPALYITIMLESYLPEMMQNFKQEYTELEKFIDEQRAIRHKTGPNDKCKDSDRKANEYMQAVNPRIKEIYQRHLDKFRTWLNAWCTWKWYIVGNVKNTVVIDYIGWVGYLLDLHRQAVQTLKFERATCVEAKINSPASIAELPIPSFNCPVVVSIPVGLEELRLGAEATGLNDNSFGITQSGGAMPNVTISFGVGKSSITEPGLYGNPYIKTANGSINQSGFNYADNSGDELTPISKIPFVDELTPPNPKLPTNQKNQKLTKQDAQQLLKAKLARQLLNKLMTADCPDKIKKPKLKIDIGKIEFEDEPGINIEVGEIEFLDESNISVETGKIEFVDEPQVSVEMGKVEFEDMATNGIQPTITNGLGAPGNSKNFVKGLFN